MGKKRATGHGMRGYFFPLDLLQMIREYLSKSKDRSFSDNNLQKKPCRVLGSAAKQWPRLYCAVSQTRHMQEPASVRLPRPFFTQATHRFSPLPLFFSGQSVYFTIPPNFVFLFFFSLPKQCPQRSFHNPLSIFVIPIRDQVSTKADAGLDL
jgi:hypothetical protein